MVTITYKKLFSGECIMKKALVFTMLAGSLLFGEARHLDRMKNMSEMENAMSEIQKVFLYDNVNVLQNGLKHIKENLKFNESFIKDGVVENNINNKIY